MHTNSSHFSFLNTLRNQKEVGFDSKSKRHDLAIWIFCHCTRSWIIKKCNMVGHYTLSLNFMGLVFFLFFCLAWFYSYTYPLNFMGLVIYLFLCCMGWYGIVHIMLWCSNQNKNIDTFSNSWLDLNPLGLLDIVITTSLLSIVWNNCIKLVFIFHFFNLLRKELHVHLGAFFLPLTY
jgi:hypothetical protein